MHQDLASFSSPAHPNSCVDQLLSVQHATNQQCAHAKQYFLSRVYLKYHANVLVLTSIGRRISSY